MSCRGEHTDGVKEQWCLYFLAEMTLDNIIMTNELRTKNNAIGH